MWGWFLVNFSFDFWLLNKTLSQMLLLYASKTSSQAGLRDTHICTMHSKSSRLLWNSEQIVFHLCLNIISTYTLVVSASADWLINVQIKWLISSGKIPMQAEQQSSLSYQPWSRIVSGECGHTEGSWTYHRNAYILFPNPNSCPCKVQESKGRHEISAPWCDQW